MTLIKDLIEIPDHVEKGQFVLRLAEGVTRPEETLHDYVVTPELKACTTMPSASSRAACNQRRARPAICMAASAAARATSWPCCT